MNWKKWKLGLAVAILTGIATAFAVGIVVPTMTWRQGLFVLLGSVGKDLLLFLQQNQVKDISFDTATITKNEKTTSTPANPPTP